MMGWRNLLGVFTLPAAVAVAGPPPPLLAPGSTAVIPIGACGRGDMLFVLSKEGQLHRLGLIQGTRDILDAPAPLESIACNKGALWALADMGRTLYRLDEGGRVLANVSPPEVLAAIASNGEELLAVVRPLAAGATLLWRGVPPKLSPWALQAR